MNDSPADPTRPDKVLDSVAAVSLRLMAGAVPRKTMARLQETLRASPSEYPWQVVVRAILAEPADEQALVQQGLRAQRDWILRGGRLDPGKPLGVKAKTLLAKVLTQGIVFGIFFVLTCMILLLLRQKFPSADLYQILFWLQDHFPRAFPRAG
ncbi:MAG: hypothetical protein Fur0037_20470 [Planctomycetota bacterium]